MVGRLTIGFISSAVTGFLQEKVKKFREQYPAVTLDLEQSVSLTIMEEIENAQMDIGIVRLPLDIPSSLVAMRKRPNPIALRFALGLRLK